jgi:hypothetical protein
MSIGRIYAVSPRQGEKYFLRVLLHHVKGATSWDHLPTVENVQHCTFQETCVARGLLQDDAEWVRCMDEASGIGGSMMAWQLRNLFAVILDYNRPQKPDVLWHRFKGVMCEDYVHKAKQQGVLQPDMAEMENAALWDIELLLLQAGFLTVVVCVLPVFCLRWWKKMHKETCERNPAENQAIP